MQEPLRVAQIMGKMNRGGVEAVVMNYYRAMDKTKIQFDFFLDEDSEFPQRQELERAGAGIFILPPYFRMWAWQKQLTQQLRKGGYSIVHAHINTMNVFPLFCAWRAGIPVRICHNHSTAQWREGKKTVLKYLLRPFNKLFATHWFACGKKAAEWMYGRRAVAHEKVVILPNAIDTKHYAFCREERVRLREQLGIGQDVLVLGHIGRYAYAKNHAFLLHCFAALLQRDSHAKLLLVGEGERKVQIQNEIERLQLGHAVIQAGPQADTAPFYSVMDVFCLPSFYEGFPVVALEAQANGLPCLFSQAVPAQACVLRQAERLPQHADAECWAEHIIGCAGRREPQAYKTIARAGFDIHTQCHWLEQFYLKQQRRTQACPMNL